MFRVEIDFRGWTHYRDLTPTQRAKLRQISKLGERETKRVYKRFASCLLELATQDAAAALVQPDILQTTPQLQEVDRFVRLSSELDSSFNRMTAVTRGGLEVRLKDYRSRPDGVSPPKAPPEEQTIELAVNVLRALVAMRPKPKTQGRPQTPSKIRRVAREMVRAWVENGGKPSLSKRNVGLTGLVPEVLRLNPIICEILISPLEAEGDGRSERQIKSTQNLSKLGPQIVGQMRPALKRFRAENRRQK